MSGNVVQNDEFIEWVKYECDCECDWDTMNNLASVSIFDI